MPVGAQQLRLMYNLQEGRAFDQRVLVAKLKSFVIRQRGDWVVDSVEATSAGAAAK